MPVPVSKYDAIGRLTKIENLPGSPGEQAQEFEYFYNLSGQRALRIDSRHRSWQYEYDDFGQLTNAANHFFDGMNKAAGSEAPSQSPTGSLVPAMQFGYSYDDIGNRTQTRRGGDTSRTASYSANQLNQITQRDVPGKYDIYGLAAMAVTPKVNGANVPPMNPNAANPVEKAYFNTTLSTANAAGPKVESITVEGQGGSLPAGTAAPTYTGEIELPKTPELFSYDYDGNLTNDGSWSYTWDAENRLIEMTRASGWPAANSLKLVFDYDHQGRRIRKRVHLATGQLKKEIHFVYDNWNLISRMSSFDTTANAAQTPYSQNFVWGIDLSSTVHGAGGVGGLVGFSRIAQSNDWVGCLHDGNGNVTQADGLGETYEYDPFGNALKQTASGGLTHENPFRFSTKYFDSESANYYYGHRYYNPDTGRWLSREPLGEAETPNLYGFVRNDPANSYDVLGMYQEGGHYYTTYIAAMIAGKGQDASMQLAFHSQLPDELKSMIAWYANSATDNAAGKALGNFGPLPLFPRFNEIQRYLHSLDNGLAAPRRECLSNLLKDPSLKDWERGLLIHAYGDSYAHSDIDRKEIIGAGKTRRKNPNFGKEVLYPAPLGHAQTPLGGSWPDYISQRPDLYVRYLYNLTETLNGGPLSSGQMDDLMYVAVEALQFDPRMIGQAEIAAMRKISRNERFGYPVDGYRPEKSHTAHTRGGFLSGPGGMFGPGDLPSMMDVNGLLEKIKAACCKK